MQIRYLRIDEINNYENNARTHSKEQINQIVNSIKEFGFNNPILIDEHRTIIAGHGRLLAAKELKLDEVPTLTLSHLTPLQKKAYILADNRIALNAEWDINKLQIEFNALLDDDFDIKLTGFTDDEINIYSGKDINEGLCDAEEIPEIEENPTNVEGNLWTLGEHRLLCGDSTNQDNVDKLCNAIVPILMVTDPPYGVNYEPEWRNGHDKNYGKRSILKVLNDDKIDWSEAYKLFKGNVIYLWHASLYTHIIAENLINCNFELKYLIIWNKNNLVFGRGDYHWKHEACWYAVRKGKDHNWHGDRKQTTVWDIKNNNPFGNPQKEEQLGHSTQKPTDCMSIPIKNNTKEGEYVYDPFGGSGTTLIACESYNRKCLMIEIHPLYCDMIIKRWQEFTGKKAILESSGLTFDEVANDKKT